jgi:hypothetical protein
MLAEAGTSTVRTLEIIIICRGEIARLCGALNPGGKFFTHTRTRARTHNCNNTRARTHTNLNSKP